MRKKEMKFEINRRKERKKKTKTQKMKITK